MIRTFTAAFAVVVGIVVIWALAGYRGLDLSHSLIGIIHFLGVPGTVAIALLGIHVFKKTSPDN